MKRNGFPADPYKTTAKFNSSCSVCGSPIKKHDPIVYDRYRKLVYCMESDKCGPDVLRGVQAEKSMDQYGTDIF